MTKLFLLLTLFFLFASCTRKELTWVAIGDSITYLNDHPNETDNRITKGYLTMVTEKLPQIHFINQGHNGWTSANIAASIENLGLIKADLYTIFLGTNDWWQGRPLGTISDYVNSTGNATLYGSFRIIINKLVSLNPNARIVLITPMQRTDFVYINDHTNNAYGSYREKNRQTLEQFALAIDSVARHEGFEVVDLYHQKEMEIKNLVKFKRLKDPQTGTYRNYPYPDYIDIAFHPGEDQYPYPMEAIDVTYDGLHPSDKGNSIISKMLVKIMKKY
jgi:lysophospholipase L1-like esterase